MKKNFLALLIFIPILFINSIVFAQTGNLFSVASSGSPATVKIRVCLNGYGPTSCEDYTVSNLSLSISTTIPNHTYTRVGIISLTPGYGFSGCTNYTNGYCIFTASNTSVAPIAVSATANAVKLNSVTPSSGAASGGAAVTLSGNNLTGVTGVTFGGAAATSVNIVNSTTLTAVTPSHAVGAVSVTVTTATGSSTLSNAYTYNTTAVGQSSGGGVIACLNGGLNNLISSSVDNSASIDWSSFGAPQTNATSNSDGATNTTTIVSTLGAGATYAAGLCDAYEVDSQGNAPCQPGNTCYADWFLPALDQLDCLYTNRVAIGGFTTSSGTYYWSSTENSNTDAWSINFSNSSSAYGPKISLERVRCVRSFTP